MLGRISARKGLSSTGTGCPGQGLSHHPAPRCLPRSEGPNTEPSIRGAKIAALVLLATLFLQELRCSWPSWPCCCVTQRGIYSGPPVPFGSLKYLHFLGVSDFQASAKVTQSLQTGPFPPRFPLGSPQLPAQQLGSLRHSRNPDGSCPPVPPRHEGSLHAGVHRDLVFPWVCCPSKPFVPFLRRPGQDPRA